MDSEIRVDTPQGSKSKKGSSKKEGADLMEFTIGKRDFVRGLSRAHSIAERKSSMPILSNVLLAAEGNKTLRICATDLGVSVTATHPAEIVFGGNITLSARTLFDIAKSLPEEAVHVAVSSTMSAEIRCGKSRFRMVGLPGHDFPTLPDASKVALANVPAAIVRQMIEQTYPSMSQDETRPHLAGALFEGEGSLLRMVTTDGHRLTKVERKVDGGPLHFSMLVPQKGIAELKKLVEDGDGSIGIGTDAGNAFFSRRSGGAPYRADDAAATGESSGDAAVLMVKLTEAAFPPYEQVIPKLHERVVIAPRMALTEALRRVSLVSQERSLGVKLMVEPGKVTVCTENPSIGDASEEVDVDYAGAPVTLGFNARYVIDALAAVDDSEVRLELSKELDPGVIRNVGGDEFVAVVMPMRI